jgi:hypothetical protein
MIIKLKYSLALFLACSSIAIFIATPVIPIYPDSPWFALVYVSALGFLPVSMLLALHTAYNEVINPLSDGVKVYMTPEIRNYAEEYKARRGK